MVRIPALPLLFRRDNPSARDENVFQQDGSDVDREDAINAGAAMKKIDELAGERGVDVQKDSVRNRSSIKW